MALSAKRRAQIWIDTFGVPEPKPPRKLWFCVRVMTYYSHRSLRIVERTLRVQATTAEDALRIVQERPSVLEVLQVLEVPRETR